MTLLLSPEYAQRALLEAKGIHCLVATRAEPLRVGIINLMPAAERYEPLLLAALGVSQFVVEPIFIRLTTHLYGSTDADHLARAYVTFSEAVSERRLHGLVVTGAPVEELAFSEVRYFPELSAILAQSHAEVSSTLGLCWGGMALAHLLGINKTTLPHKLFGCFAMQALPGVRANLAGEGEVRCIQSRHAGIEDREIERAAQRGLITPLAHAPRTGYSVFESRDSRYVMHLGHPEYDRERILFEYRRDRQKGRSDVPAPEGVRLDAAQQELATHGTLFFSRWLARIAGAPSANAESP